MAIHSYTGLGIIIKKMRKIIVGFIIGVLLTANWSYAYRFAKPQRITDWDDRGLVIINENYER